MLTACGGHKAPGTTSTGTGTGTGASAGSSSGKDPSKFTFLHASENTTVAKTLTSLAAGACKTENTALPLSVTAVPQANLPQKLSLLAGQNALPSAFQLPDPATAKLLSTSGQIESLSPVLATAGLTDSILPAAASTIKAQFGSMVALPTELNIEGIWYNKKIFSANGITVPTTWDELVSDSAKLKSKNVQAFAWDGKDGWPISRLIGAYIFRSLGPDALSAVASGKAKLTDPGYVKAATEVAALGKNGYGGKAVGSIDYNTAQNEFVTGKAAMWYMGSWALSVFADPAQDKIGAANIGFMPFPAVTGGKGSVDQTPANVGIPLAFSSKSFGPKTTAWMKCIVANYGHEALTKSAQITGFKVTPAATGLPALTQAALKQIAATKTSVLWFEGLFGSKQTTLSQTTVAQLVGGSLSPSSFMSAIQASNGQ